VIKMGSQFMDFDMDLAGVANVTENLNSISDSLLPTAGSNLEEYSKKTVIPKARKLCPEDTGALKSSIKLAKFGQLTQNVTYALITAGDYEHTNRWGQPTIKYAIAQERGTNRVPAHPYMRPTVQSISPKGVFGRGDFLRQVLTQRLG